VPEPATPPATPPAVPPAADGAAPALTQDAIQAMIAGAMEGSLKKLNGELAGLRRKLGALADPERAAVPADGAPAPSSAAALTADDLTLARKVGASLAKLPEAVQAVAEERLAGLTPAAQAAVLDLLSALHGAQAAPEAAASDGARRPTAPTTSRGAPAASGGQPLPRTRTEWMQQITGNPKRKAELDADLSFDPTALPYR